MVSGDAAVWIGQIITWVIMVFGGGIIYGKFSTKVDKIENSIFTPEGELRVVTYSAHDLMSANCNDKRDIRISHVIDSNKELKEDIARLSATVTAELKTMSEALHQMALCEARKSGRENRN